MFQNIMTEYLNLYFAIRRLHIFSFSYCSLYFAYLYARKDASYYQYTSGRELNQLIRARTSPLLIALLMKLIRSGGKERRF